MRVSRRQFFTRLRDAAEGPERWRERRIQELKDYALKKAPAEWTEAQRLDLARTCDEKLVYMSDDTLRDPGAERYVDAMIEAKNMYFQSSESEGDPFLEDPYCNNNLDQLG
jgi:hypothetical protein